MREQFLGALNFEPDIFQLKSFDGIDAGKNLVVAAPTGAGKTLIANYATVKAVSAGSRVFYTTPIKALSNQKYAELIEAHGADNVGLLTGDNNINGDAAIVVMTTEVLRNMLYSGNDLSTLAVVVLDEVHYLQDAYRGSVWEEVIIHLHESVQLVCLSATVSNAGELTSWIETVRGPTALVEESKRPVELTHLLMVGEKKTRHLNCIKTVKNAEPNPKGFKFDPETGRTTGRNRNKKDGSKGKGSRQRGGFQTSRWVPPARPLVIAELARRDLLPAIFFIFSRDGCDDAARSLMRSGLSLTSPGDRAKVTDIVSKHVKALSELELEVLDFEQFLAQLQSGFAAHHAGLIPAFKEAVEECFKQNLVKVVFATETLALGINMPARTVVIDKLTKFTGEGHDFLTPGQFTQLTGRAGRRGIDTTGHAVVLWSPFVKFAQVAGLAMSKEFVLTSSFKPTYNMAANFMQRYDAEEARSLLNLSFAQYTFDSTVVSVEHKLDKLRARKERTLKRLENEFGSVDELYRKRRSSPNVRKNIRRLERIDRELDRLGNEASEHSLAEQFDRIVALLVERKYAKDWELLPKGVRLCQFYHSNDLLVCEALEAGLFDGLSPEELAAFLSIFVYQERRPFDGAPDPWLPSHDFAKLTKKATDLYRAICADEKRFDLKSGPAPETGFVAIAYGWASGGALDVVLEDEDQSVGDFIRNMRQLLDLARQVAQLAPLSATRSVANAALDLLNRDIVAASNMVGFSTENEPDSNESGPEESEILDGDSQEGHDQHGSVGG